MIEIKDCIDNSKKPTYIDNYTIIIDDHRWCMCDDPNGTDGICNYVNKKDVRLSFMAALMSGSVQMDACDLPGKVKDKIIELLINLK